MLLGRAAATPGASRLQRTLRRASVAAARDLARDATRHSGGFRQITKYRPHKSFHKAGTAPAPLAGSPGLALTPANCRLRKASACLTNEMLPVGARQLVPRLSDGDAGAPFPDPEPSRRSDLCDCFIPSTRGQCGPPAASAPFALVSSSCRLTVAEGTVPSTSFHPHSKNGLAQL